MRTSRVNTGLPFGNTDMSTPSKHMARTRATDDAETTNRFTKPAMPLQGRDKWGRQS